MIHWWEGLIAGGFGWLIGVMQGYWLGWSGRG